MNPPPMDPAPHDSLVAIVMAMCVAFYVLVYLARGGD